MILVSSLSPKENLFIVPLGSLNSFTPTSTLSFNPFTIALFFSAVFERINTKLFAIFWCGMVTGFKSILALSYSFSKALNLSTISS